MESAPKFCVKDKVEAVDSVIIDFLNVYMRFLQGKYERMNEKSFVSFVTIIANYFKGKKIFFVKKLIWELPEEFHKKALLKNKHSKIFFITVKNEVEEVKYKERDDFVCYSLLNSIPKSIVITNDSKILNRKNIGDTKSAGITMDILTLHKLDVDIQKSISKNSSYNTEGDYSKVCGFKFTRNLKKIEKKIN